MHDHRGCYRVAAVLLLCGLTAGLLATASATTEEAVREQMSGDIVDPADLAAVAGPTRRLMAALTDHIKLISTEMGALRAGAKCLYEICPSPIFELIAASTRNRAAGEAQQLPEANDKR